MRGEALLGVLVLGLLFVGSAYLASTKPERYPSYPFGPAVALGSIFVVIGLTGFIWNYHQSRRIVVPVEKEPIIIRARREEKVPFGHPAEKITRFCINCGQVVASDVNFCSHCSKELSARAEVKKPIIPKRVERRSSSPVGREFVGTYVSRRGREISIYKEGRRYRIGENTWVNQSFVNNVEEYLLKSGKSLSSKEIEKGLGKYYTYKAPDIQIWNALRVLTSLGKVKRYGSGRNIRYKTTFVHYPPKPKEQIEVKHGVLAVDREQEFEKRQMKNGPVKSVDRHGQKRWGMHVCIVNRESLAREILEFVKNKHPRELEKGYLSEEICELFWKTKGVVKENIQNPEILLKIKEAELAACRKLASELEPMNLISRLPGSAGQEREQNKRINLLSTQPLQELKYEERERAQKIKKKEASIQPIKSGQKCPECWSTRLVRDKERAEIVCMDCGFIGDAGKFIGTRAEVMRAPMRAEQVTEMARVDIGIRNDFAELKPMEEEDLIAELAHTDLLKLKRSLEKQVEQLEPFSKYPTKKHLPLKVEYSRLKERLTEVSNELDRRTFRAQEENRRSRPLYTLVEEKSKTKPRFKMRARAMRALAERIKKGTSAERTSRSERHIPSTQKPTQGKKHAHAPVVGAFDRVVLGKKEILFLDEKTKNRRKK